MERIHRYKIKILKAAEDKWYKHLIGKEFFICGKYIKSKKLPVYYITVGEAQKLNNNTKWQIDRVDAWLIDTRQPELSNPIYFPDDISDRDRAEADKLFAEIKQMGIFREVWYLKSSHPYSEGLWIEFGNEEKVKANLHGYIIERYQNENS